MLTLTDQIILINGPWSPLANVANALCNESAENSTMGNTCN